MEGNPFQEYPGKYDQWFEDNQETYMSELEAIKLLMPKVNKSIEIGVGTGRFALPLAIKEGVEPSREMGKVAKSKGITVYEGVGEQLPLEDSSYQLVVMVTTICFLSDVAKAMEEAYRITEEGGYIIISFIDRNSLLGKKYEENKERSTFYKGATFYSADEVISYVKKAGFKEILTNQTVFSFDNTRHPIKEGHGEGSFVTLRGKK